jgi:hypothetical protein
VNVVARAGREGLARRLPLVDALVGRGSSRREQISEGVPTLTRDFSCIDGRRFALG